MAHQEEGWPLGLRPVNARIGGLTRGTHHHHHEQVSAGSISFTSLLSPSPSSHSSSDLDSQSMGSFFQDRSYTLGNLIGISSFLDQTDQGLTIRLLETIINNRRILNFTSHGFSQYVQNLSDISSWWRDEPSDQPYGPHRLYECRSPRINS